MAGSLAGDANGAEGVRQELTLSAPKRVGGEFSSSTNGAVCRKVPRESKIERAAREQKRHFVSLYTD